VKDGWFWAIALAIAILAGTTSANQWEISCEGIPALICQPGRIESIPAYGEYYPFSSNEGEEPQPVLVPWRVGPMMMNLPWGVDQARYNDGNQETGDDEGFVVDYAWVGISFREINPIKKLKAELNSLNVHPAESEIITEEINGLPAAYCKGAWQIGVFQYDGNTITVTVISDHPERLDSIMNSISKPAW